MNSDDGTLLAYGSSDLSVGVLDATTLRVRCLYSLSITILSRMPTDDTIGTQSLMTILRAHDFPVTSLRFNPSADLVISGSADNTVRVVTVPSVTDRGEFFLPLYPLDCF